MKENTPLDTEAAKRATSVYLVDRRIDMLPKMLTEILCSVRGEEESLCFSVVWEMTKEAEVVNTRSAKTVVHSNGALSYEVAWKRICDKSLNDPVTKGLRWLQKLSEILKQKRIDAGALELSSTEMKVKLDVETGETIGVSAYEKFPTCSMIEEFMLFANIAVARKIYEHFPTAAFLRRHPAPNEGQFEGLQEALKHRGFKPLDLKSSKHLADSLNATVDPKDEFFNILVRMMTTRCMQQAKYLHQGSSTSQTSVTTAWPLTSTPTSRPPSGATRMILCIGSWRPAWGSRTCQRT
jgi:exosome complex exonuclease DIS3/RRP44